MAYTSTQAHLLDELNRIDAILNAYEAAQKVDTADDRPEIDPQTIVDDPDQIPLALPADKREVIATLTDQIEQQCRQTESVTLRLRVLTETFDLSRRQLDVLLLALAPRIDEHYTQRFERLHESTSLSRLTVILVEKLFSRTATEAVTTGVLLGNDSPLRQHELIKFLPAPDRYSSERGRLITVPDRIVDYLKGCDGVDPELKATLEANAPTQDTVLTNCEATTTLSELAIDGELAERLNSCAESTDTAGGRRYYWYGPSGTDTHRAVEAVCETEQYLRADLRAVLEADALEWLGREATLLGRPLHLTQANAAVKSHGRPNTTLESVFRALAEWSVDVFVTGTESWTPSGATTGVDAIIEFPYPSIELREQFWESHSAELPADVDPEVLAGTFRLTHGQLRAALSTARSMAGEDDLTVDDIYAGCSAQSASELAELAERIEPESNWDDIQLRAETERKLQLVRTHIKQQATIYSDWGFAEQFSRSTGVVALFEGPSGTGKTMAAEILAGDVGMDLYRIDLSSVVSKYIGETEQNLEVIFEAATNSNAVLLFDEADAVFGDRAAVSDATDRYANAEVNYLLQRIERYDGVVLLTTNYSSNIDSAFKRRIDHTVTFRKPQKDTRTAIWQKLFPDDAPLGEIDYEFLSSFKFTGGQIKTIGQTAAILAAEGRPNPTNATIEMEHLIQAVQLAFEQNGRLVDRSTYGSYQELLYDASNADSEIDSKARGTTDTKDEIAPSSNAADKRTVETPTETAHDSAPDIRGDNSVSPASADAETGDKRQPPERTPEEVVRAFVDRLAAGDMDGVNELYHSNAVVDRFSRKDLLRLKQGELSIISELTRVREDASRVVVEFVQQMNETEQTVSYELRRDGTDWFVFNIQRASNKRAYRNAQTEDSVRKRCDR